MYTKVCTVYKNAKSLTLKSRLRFYIDIQTLSSSLLSQP